MSEKIKHLTIITDKEYIEICSTFITLTQPKYRCHDCNLKYRSDKEKFKKNRSNMACDYMANKPRHQYKPDFNNKGNPIIKYKNCIGNHYYGKWAGIINYYNMYESGIMPFTGGMMDQPAKFVEIMQLVHNLISENQKEVERKTNLATRKVSGRK